MTLVSDIIRDAYRETNIIALGTATSSLQDQEALTALNRFVKSVYDREGSERPLSINIGSTNVARPDETYNYLSVLSQSFVPSNSRLVLNLAASLTVYLDPTPMDGARFAFIDKSNNLATFPLTVNANGRSIGGLTSQVFNTNSQSLDYIYDETSGDWRKILPLVASDTWPFPTEFDDFFIISLAIRLNPRYQMQLDAQSQAVYKRSASSFKSRYRQSTTVTSERGLISLPSSPTLVGVFSGFNTG